MPDPILSTVERRDLIRGASLLATAAPVAATVRIAEGSRAPTPAVVQANEGGRTPVLRGGAPAVIGRRIPELEREAPLPLGERVGFAVAGLGKFALNEILPAFASCRRAKMVSLVSGDAAKARTVAAQYGVAERAIHDYAGFDRIADDLATAYDVRCMWLSREKKETRFLLPMNNQFAAELDHMAECVQIGQVSRTPGEEGCATSSPSRRSTRRCGRAGQCGWRRGECLPGGSLVRASTSGSRLRDLLPWPPRIRH